MPGRETVFLGSGWKRVTLTLLGFGTLGGLLGALGEDASPEQRGPTVCTGFLVVPDTMMKDGQE